MDYFDSQTDNIKELRVGTFLNLSIWYFQQKDYSESLSNANKALEEKTNPT